MPAPAPQPAPHKEPGPPPAKQIRGTRYGGFWIRFLAAIIDSLIVQVLVLPVVIPLRISLEFVPGIGPATRSDIAVMQDMVLFSIIYLIYQALMESSAQQATLGKRVFNLKVTTLAGSRISLARAIGRHVAKYISSFVFLLGYVMAGFTARKQALHDMIAGTLVESIAGRYPL